MNEMTFNDATLGRDLTEAEMAAVTGGDSPVLYTIGYLLGVGGAMIVQTATDPNMQQYCFGA